MKPYGTRVVPITLAILLLAANASAGKIVPVNGAGSGVFTFDQPAVVSSGTVVHVVFIGDAAGDNTFKLYYAAVDKSANFKDPDATQADILLTAAVAIDNGSKYRDARHPQVAVRETNELVVLFQGVPTASVTGEYKLFRARIGLLKNAVTSQVVDEILDTGSTGLPGNLVDPTFQVANSDDTLRIAYADASTGYNNVYFIRVGIDNAAVVGGPILLSYLDSSRGIRPVPRLKTDGNGWSHVVWAANDNSSNPTGIYYSLVRKNKSGVQDNLAIGATQVIYGNYRWGFPTVIVTSTESVFVFAVDQPYGFDGTAGALAFSRLDPSEVKHDGQPVNVNNLATLSSFFLSHPGGMVLTDAFDAYRPDVLRDSSGYFHVAGYGYRSTDSPYHGTPGRYYVMDLADLVESDSAASVPPLLINPLPVGTGDASFGMQIAGDYTRAAYAHFSEKALHFWSGPDNVTVGASNLYVTYTNDVDLSSSDSSGCSVAADPRVGDAGRIPGALLLLFPALLLLLLKTARRALARR